MTINNLEVTGNFVEIVDINSVHLELGNCIRLVQISDTEFETVEDLKTAVENLIL
jgi:hypothetical protein